MLELVPSRLCTLVLRLRRAFNSGLAGRAGRERELGPVHAGHARGVGAHRLRGNFGGFMHLQPCRLTHAELVLALPSWVFLFCMLVGWAAPSRPPPSLAGCVTRAATRRSARTCMCYTYEYSVGVGAHRHCYIAERCSDHLPTHASCHPSNPPTAHAACLVVLLLLAAAAAVGPAAADDAPRRAAPVTLHAQGSPTCMP